MITFLSGFIPALAVLVQGTNFADIEKAGMVGGFFMLLRLVVKAAYEGFTVMIVWMAQKFKELRK